MMQHLRILVPHRGKLGDQQHHEQMGKLRLKQLNQAFPPPTSVINPAAGLGEDGGIKASDLGTSPNKQNILSCL